MKRILKNIKKFTKPLTIFCCIGIVAAAVYTDVFNLTDKSPVSDYLYSSEYTEGKTKILGEATLVDSKADISQPKESYFSNASLNKEKSRDEALETLQVVVDNSESLPEERQKALDEIIQIANDIETEAAVEEMIKAKGFSDCVAIISGQNINVIVKSEGLLTSEVAQITDIVMSQTNFEPENIRIVEKF